jgi:hypothetical protein
MLPQLQLLPPTHRTLAHNLGQHNLGQQELMLLPLRHPLPAHSNKVDLNLDLKSLMLLLQRLLLPARKVLALKQSQVGLK